MNSLVRNIRTTLSHGKLPDMRNILKQKNTSFLEIHKPEFKLISPKKGGYQKFPLHEEELFQLYYIKWGAMSSSGTHSHAKYKCFFKILEGNITEYVYPSYTDSCNLFTKHIYTPGYVAYIDNSIGFHNMSNNNNHDAYSLHLYFRDDHKFK